MTRQKLTIFMAGLLGFLISCTGQTKDKKQTADILSDKFKVGQVWKFDNRVGEDGATLTILKIEKYDKGDTIIHIRVDGVKMHNPKVASGYSDEIGPFLKRRLKDPLPNLWGKKIGSQIFRMDIINGKRLGTMGKAAIGQ